MANAATTPLSIEEYLHARFEHDAEYRQGNIIQRSMPTLPHSLMQAYLGYVLFLHARALGFEVLSEQRIRTQPGCYRIPDVCLTRGMPSEDVLTHPPYLCIEILSPDDSATELRAKLAEYLAFGVEYIWVIDPVSRTGEVHTVEGIDVVSNGVFRAGPIEVDATMVPRRT